MEAMVLMAPQWPLERMELRDPAPGPGQILVKVDACGVCRTDLHVVDGELPHADHFRNKLVAALPAAN